MDITTNHHWRQFKYADEVPAETIKWYDWLNEDERFDGWICYRGSWTHISDYMRGGFEGWQGSHGDSYFSATVINISEDGEEYQIGLALA